MRLFAEGVVPGVCVLGVVGVSGLEDADNLLVVATGGMGTSRVLLDVVVTAATDGVGGSLIPTFSMLRTILNSSTLSKIYSLFFLANISRRSSLFLN